MRIKKNGKTINLTEADIKRLKNTLLKEQVPSISELIDWVKLLVVGENPEELEKLTDEELKKKMEKQHQIDLKGGELTPETIKKIKSLLKGKSFYGSNIDTDVKFPTPPASESVIKIKKGGDTFNLTESDIKKLNVFLLTEQRAGIIQQGDTDFCLIVCNTKHAKYGSNGEMVKKIQHLLAANGFNEEYVGGGMESGCKAEWPSCDGKFRKHTKDAVIEFQKKYKLTPDGIVGPLTLKKMCEVLKSTNSLMKKPLCPDCQCDDQRPGDPVKELPGKGYDKIIRDLDCDIIKACISKFNIDDWHGNKERWYRFLDCIGYKNPIKDLPIQKIEPRIRKEPPATRKYPYKDIGGDSGGYDVRLT